MSSRTTGKVTSVVAIGGALALATAGCGAQGGSDSGGKDSDPKTAVTEALKGLEKTPYEATMTMGDMGSGEFSVDLANKAQQGTMSVDGGAMGGGQMDMEFIGIDTDYWMKMSGQDIPPQAQDKWIHMSTEDSEQFGGGLDMEDTTKQMIDSLDDVKEKKDNTYTATMKLDALTEGMGGGGGAEEPGTEPGQDGGGGIEDPLGDKPGGEESQPGEDQQGEDGPQGQDGEQGEDGEGKGEDSLEVTLTLDDDGNLKKLDMPVPGAGEGEEQTVSMEITKFDAKVNVEAPAEEETIEMDELTGGGTPGMTP